MDHSGTALQEWFASIPDIPAEEAEAMATELRAVMVRCHAGLDEASEDNLWVWPETAHAAWGLSAYRGAWDVLIDGRAVLSGLGARQAVDALVLEMGSREEELAGRRELRRAVRERKARTGELYGEARMWVLQQRAAEKREGR